MNRGCDKPVNDDDLWIVESLEARLLYSADGLGGLFDPLDALTPDDIADPHDLLSNQGTLAIADRAAGDDSIAGRHLVFIDEAVTDRAQIVSSWQAVGAEVVLLDVRSSGMSVISDVLKDGGPVAAMDIVAHGSDGSLLLGNTELSLGSLDQWRTDLERWDDALVAGADIRLYGCDLAATVEGQALIDVVAALTGADVAASTDLTGHSSLGGDWHLEYSTGIVVLQDAVVSAFADQWVDTLANVTVTTVNDVVDGNTTNIALLLASPGADGLISLREAVTAANGDLLADTITLGAGTYVLTIDAGGGNALSNDLDVEQSLTILGDTAANTEIVVDSGLVFRHFDVFALQTLTLENLTLRDGNVTENGGAIRVRDTGTLIMDQVILRDNTVTSTNGGALWNEGTTQLTNVEFIDNTAQVHGGAIFNENGATLLELDGVTLSGNQALTGEGGAIYDHGDRVTINNTTISGNSSERGGGAIHAQNSVTITNSTIVGNYSDEKEGGLDLHNGGVFEIGNTIIAGNTAKNGPFTDNNITGDIVSLGFNLFDAEETDVTLEDTDQLVSDPGLGPLQNNGGFVRTHALESGSPALNAGGSSSSSSGANDQGHDQIPDIGAHEQVTAGGVLYFTDGVDTVFRTDEDGGNVQLLLDNRDQPGKIELDFDNGYMYWSEMGSGGKIFRADLDGTNIVEMLSGLTDITSFALDASAEEVYVLLGGATNEVRRYALSGGALINTTSTLVNNPRDIVLDEAGDRVFWSNQAAGADSAFIAVVGIDGSGSATLISDSVLDVPLGLNYDSATDRLYWVDSDTNTISYVVTSNPAAVVDAGISGDVPSGLTYDSGNDRLLWVGTDGLLETSDLALSAVSTLVDLAQTPVSLAFGATTVFDPVPSVSVNTGATLAEGATTLLNATHLETIDSDTDPVDLVYTVSDAADNGILVLTSNPGVAIATFTQADLDAGLVRYEHDDSETLSDQFTFTVSDGTNTTAATDFDLTVTAVNDETPVVAVNNGASLNEGATVTLGTTALSATDADAGTAAVDLVFNVTSALSNGQLELTTGAGVAITTFTQADLAANRVVYIHDGSETTSDQFSFTVTDGTNTTAATDFDLTVTAVNDETPVVAVNNGASLNEGATVTLGTTALSATDADAGTAAADLVFSVTSALSNGQLELTTGAGVAITTFTQADLAANRVVYIHDGSETTSDQFSFTVTDGTNTTAATDFDLTITAVNDETPVVAVNAGATLNEGATVTLGTTALSATDADAGTAAADLVFSVTSALTNGQLELTTGAGVAITTFTQADLAANRVVYIHDGSETTSDQFSFTVTDGTNTTAATDFDLTITAVNDETPVVAVNTGATLNEGATVTIGTTVLSATDADAGTAAADLVFNVTSALTNGQLELTTGAGVAITTFTQADLAANRVVYIHDGSETTSDQFSFTVTDGTNTTAATDFDLTITPVNDQAPAIITTAGATLNEGAILSIGNTVLSGADADTPAANLTYTVTTAPGNGILSLNNNTGVAISSFTQADIDAGRLQYEHDGSETISDQFSVTLTDGVATTAAESIDLTITPVDDGPPMVAVNTGATVAEGQVITVSSAMLDTTDADTGSASVRYTVSSAPTNGQLVLSTNPGVAITSFTQAEIDLGRLQYEHDDSETTADQFTFTVTDGVATTAATVFNLTVTPVNDEPPVIDVNTGASLNEGATVILDASLLSVSDADPGTLASVLVYTVTSAVSNGQLELTTNTGVAISTFTQADIAANRVQYVHDDSESTIDQFSFTVTDGTNTTAAADFDLTITAVNDEIPVVATNTGATVDEEATVTLGTTVLSVSDADAGTVASDLVYTVTSAASNGQLELVSGAGVAITTFTQADIAANRVVYVHDGSETTSDQLSFTVTDGTNTTVAADFDLTITPVNDQLPVVVNNTGATLNEGAIMSITNTELSVVDADTAPADLVFTLDTFAANGILSFSDNTGVAVTTFTQADIDAGRLQYEHDGSETLSDRFSVTVSDGVAGNTLPDFDLTILPVDDGPPMVAVNTGATVAEGGSITVTNAALSTTDVDTGSASVRYTISTAPANGQLVLSTNPGVAITSFTQAEIDLGRVQYEHDGSETTADQFTFTVSDGVATTAATVFNLTVTPVNDELPVVAVNTGASLDEGASVTLGATVLNVTDGDAGTAASDLVYAVTSAVSNGQLELTTGAGVGITSFTQADIDANRVVYVHNGSETTSDQFSFTVTDGTNTTAPATDFALTITAVNDETPLVSTNTGATLDEGTTVVLGTTELSVSDADAGTAATDLVYTVTSAVTSGQLELTTGAGVAITTFTQADVAANRVVYIHDGSETTSDQFSFTVTDGTNTTVATDFDLTITPVNDEAPAIVINTGATLDEGAILGIGNALLSGVDTDTAAVNLTYTVTTAPLNGILSLNNNTGVAITSFTQADIDAGRLQYEHEGSETISDQFSVTLTDGVVTTAVSTFDLSVTPVDDEPPVVAANTGATVAEGQVITVSNAMLNTTDADTGSGNVRYTVSSVAVNGLLALGTNPGVAITSFTQADIDLGRVQYEHDGSETTADQFTFTVSDGVATTAATVFSLNVTEVNDELPDVAVNAGAIVSEGASVVLDATVLSVRDGDSGTAASDLVYTVTSAVSNGQLELTTDTGVAIATFTQADIAASRVVYVHDGSETLSDQFRFTVTDGTNTTVAVEFDITIAPVSDAPVAVDDTIRVVQGATVSVLQNNETSLLANDSDIDSPTLIATLESGPTAGALTLNADGTFVYIHDGSAGDTDQFTYRVTDESGAFSLATVALSVDARPIEPLVITDLDNLRVAENQTAAVIGRVQSSGGVETAPLTYSVDDARFVIIDNILSLRAGESLDHETEPSVAITISATDAAGSVASRGFTLRVDDVNDQPQLSQAISAPTLDGSSGFVLPAGAFTDQDGDNLVYSVRLASGDPLPEWVAFDSAARQLSFGEIPVGTESLALSVTAADEQGAEAQVTLQLLFDLPVIEPEEPDLAPAEPEPEESLPAEIPRLETPSVSESAPAPEPESSEPESAEPSSDTESAEESLSNRIAEANVRLATVIVEHIDLSNLLGEVGGFDRESLAVISAIVRLDGVLGDAGEADDPVNSLSLAALFDIPDQVARETVDGLLGLFESEREAQEEAARFAQTLLGSSLSVTSGVTVGYLIWLIRGGTLMGSVMSSLPAWRLVDPLPVLSTVGLSGDQTGDTESLESLVSSRSPVPGGGSPHV